MNDLTHPVAAPQSPDHWEDGFGWALAQAELIRARKLNEIDWEHLLEELEAMARSHYRALESALRILLTHLLKWDVQPAFRSKSWLYTIQEHGRRYRELLDDHPSLQPRLDEIRESAYAAARKLALSETGLDLKMFPTKPPGWNVINNPSVHEDDIPVR